MPAEDPPSLRWVSLQEQHLASLPPSALLQGLQKRQPPPARAPEALLHIQSTPAALNTLSLLGQKPDGSTPMRISPALWFTYIFCIFSYIWPRFLPGSLCGCSPNSFPSQQGLAPSFLPVKSAASCTHHPEHPWALQPLCQSPSWSTLDPPGRAGGEHHPDLGAQREEEEGGHLACCSMRWFPMH